MPMTVTNYDDVLIDVCPSCRGVWLDRGELQKIIAHVRMEESGEIGEDFAKDPPPAPKRDRDDRRDYDDRRDRDDRRDHDDRDKRKREKYDRDDDYDREKKKKKKKGWGIFDALEDLIDFD